MSQRAAIKGTYADYRRIKGRKVLQLIIEVPIEQSKLVHDAFGEPSIDGSTWVAVARLLPEEATASTQKPKRKFNDLSLSAQAALKCAEPTFKAFMNEAKGYEATYKEEVADAVRELCEVKSRSEFDTDSFAALKWSRLNNEYEAWKLI